MAHRIIKNDKARQAVYIGGAAVLSILTVYGVVTEEAAEQIENLVVQVVGVLGLLLASANVDKAPADDEYYDDEYDDEDGDE